jgi:hypothetical protein
MSEVDTPSETVDCTDIDGVVARLFDQPPGPRHSVILDFQTHDVADPQKIIFRTLGQILTRGLLYKFGQDVHLEDLAPAHIEEMKDYMRMVGYEVWIDEEIDQKASNTRPSQLLPWILSIRHPPGVGRFFRVMFCEVMP